MFYVFGCFFFALCCIIMILMCLIIFVFLVCLFLLNALLHRCHESWNTIYCQETCSVKQPPKCRCDTDIFDNVVYHGIHNTNNNNNSPPFRVLLFIDTATKIILFHWVFRGRAHGICFFTWVCKKGDIYIYI